MNLFPVKSFSMRSELASGETLQKIKELRFEEEESELDQLVNHFASPAEGAFGLVIKGNVETHEKQVIVTAKLRINSIALVFFSLWTIGLGWWSMEAFAAESRQVRYDSYPFIPLALIFVFYAMMLTSFNFHARKFERRLRQATRKFNSRNQKYENV